MAQALISKMETSANPWNSTGLEADTNYYQLFEIIE